MAKTYPLGAKPRDPDPRDYSLASILPPRGALTRRLWARPILLDQGGYGTCVANAWTHFLTDDPIQHADKNLLDPAKQPSYAQLGTSAYWTDPVTGEVDYQGDGYAAELYAVRMYDAIHKLYEDPDPARENGCYTIDGAKLLQKRGLVGNYYRAASLDEVITTVLNVSPVVFASPWYNSMWGTSKRADNNQWLTVSPGSGIAGYHAWLLDAVDLAPSSGLPAWGRLHNSWGPGWGKNGVAMVSIADLQTLYINDCWIATELPSS